jgi:diguanylate cyclase (GGDEF)-like protein
MRADAGSPSGIEAIPTIEARETSGITSRLLLAYLERAGGRAAVEETLLRAEMLDREVLLRGESYWFSWDTKIKLFEAAAEVLGDPLFARTMGETALELGISDSVQTALRALGSPSLVYRNVVRANARFNASHRMDLLDLGPQHARISFSDASGEGRFHPLDCDYSMGMLASVPVLFGLPHARVAHPACVGSGADACVYELTWNEHASAVPFALSAGAVGAAALAASLLFAPALLPAGVAAVGAAATAAALRAHAVDRGRWRRLEHSLRAQADVGEALAASLRDLAGELRLGEVLQKVTENAQSAVGGKEYALLVGTGDGGYASRTSASLPPATLRALERWLLGESKRLAEPLVVDDMALIDELEPATRDEAMPLRSLCAAPLAYRGQVLGVLVALAGTTRTFLPRDIDLLRSYAVQAAIALTNARLYEAQERLAARDPLTGLLNRRELQEHMEREVERCLRHGGRWSLVLLDLDGFKSINDEGGHSAGDAVLREVGRCLSESSRSSDLAFRLGGDEFALLLPSTPDVDAATASAERARAAIAALDSRLDASYGVAVWPDDGSEGDAVLVAADSRLYEMKGHGSPRHACPHCGTPA